jgi:hypothetical protein
MKPQDFTWMQRCVPMPQSCPNIDWFWALAAGLGLVLIWKQDRKERNQ